MSGLFDRRKFNSAIAESKLPSTLLTLKEAQQKIKSNSLKELDLGQVSVSGRGAIRTLTLNTKNTVYNLAFFQEGFLAGISYHNTSNCQIKIWKISTGECVFTVEEYCESIVALPEGLLASASWNGIKIWKINTGECVLTIKGGCKSIVALPEGLLASDHSNRIEIWKANTGKCVLIIKKEDEYYGPFAVLPEELLAIGSTDGTIKIWNVTTGKHFRTLGGFFTKHSDKVYVLAPLPGGFLASGSSDGKIKIWNVINGTCVHTLVLKKHNSDPATISALTVLPEGLLAGSYDTTIKVWKVNTWECVGTIETHRYYHSLAALHEGFLASGSSGLVEIWNIRSLNSLMLSEIIELMVLLKTNRSVTRLKLDFQDIGTDDRFFSALAEFLVANTTLTFLDLGTTPIPISKILELKKILRTRKSKSIIEIQHEQMKMVVGGGSDKDAAKPPIAHAPTALPVPPVHPESVFSLLGADSASAYAVDLDSLENGDSSPNGTHNKAQKEHQLELKSALPSPPAAALSPAPFDLFPPPANTPRRELEKSKPGAIATVATSSEKKLVGEQHAETKTKKEPEVTPNITPSDIWPEEAERWEQIEEDPPTWHYTEDGITVELRASNGGFEFVLGNKASSLSAEERSQAIELLGRLTTEFTSMVEGKNGLSINVRGTNDTLKDSLERQLQTSAQGSLGQPFIVNKMSNDQYRAELQKQREVESEEKKEEKAPKAIFECDVERLKEMAIAGDKDAQVMLGRAYLFAIGTTKNVAEAKLCLELATNDLNSPSAFYMAQGLRHEEGLGVEKNAKEAFGCYQKAAHRKYAPAQNALGLCYLYAIGTTKDEHEAAKWFHLAADQGFVSAQKALKSLNLQATSAVSEEPSRPRVAAAIAVAIAAPPLEGRPAHGGHLSPATPFEDINESDDLGVDAAPIVSVPSRAPVQGLSLEQSPTPKVQQQTKDQKTEEKKSELKDNPSAPAPSIEPEVLQSLIALIAQQQEQSSFFTSLQLFEKEAKARHEQLNQMMGDGEALSVMQGTTQELQRVIHDTQGVLHAEKERALILEDEVLGDYYFILHRQFLTSWLACMTIYSEWVKRIENGKRDMVDFIPNLLEKVSVNASFQGAALVKNVLLFGVEFKSNRDKKVAVIRMAKYFVKLIDADNFINAFARHLTLAKATDLRKLAAKKVGVFKKAWRLATKITDEFLANDIDTVIKKQAAEDCKKVLKAIMSGTLKPHPKLSDLDIVLAQVMGDGFHYCSPVAKEPSVRPATPMPPAREESKASESKTYHSVTAELLSSSTPARRSSVEELKRWKAIQEEKEKAREEREKAQDEQFQAWQKSVVHKHEVESLKSLPVDVKKLKEEFEKHEEVLSAVRELGGTLAELKNGQQETLAEVKRAAGHAARGADAAEQTRAAVTVPPQLDASVHNGVPASPPSARANTQVDEVKVSIATAAVR